MTASNSMKGSALSFNTGLHFFLVLFCYKTKNGISRLWFVRLRFGTHVRKRTLIGWNRPQAKMGGKREKADWYYQWRSHGKFHPQFKRNNAAAASDAMESTTDTTEPAPTETTEPAPWSPFDPDQIFTITEADYRTKATQTSPIKSKPQKSGFGRYNSFSN